LSSISFCTFFNTSGVLQRNSSAHLRVVEVVSVPALYSWKHSSTVFSPIVGSFKKLKASNILLALIIFDQKVQ